MSKHEPIYQCSLCSQFFYADEIEEHTAMHIEEGIFRELSKK